MGHGWGLRTSDISELETQMQEIQNHNQNRITTVEAEVTQVGGVLSRMRTDFSRAARMIGLSASNPPSIRSSNGTGKALLKEQGQ